MFGAGSPLNSSHPIGGANEEQVSPAHEETCFDHARDECECLLETPGVFDDASVHVIDEIATVCDPRLTLLQSSRYLAPFGKVTSRCGVTELGNLDWNYPSLPETTAQLGFVDQDHVEAGRGVDFDLDSGCYGLKTGPFT